MLPKDITHKRRTLATIAFNLVDKDHSGKISMKEMKTFMKQRGETSFNIVSEYYMNRLDEDGDGKISLDEFLKFYVIPDDD